MLLKANRRIPAGLSSFGTEEADRINAVTERLKEIFSTWGYKQVIPPTIVYQHDLDSERIEGKNSLKIMSDSGENLRLRSDITIAVTQSVASNFQEKDLPLHFYYIENSFQDIAPGAGQLREKLQAGVEFFGGNNLRHVEIIHLATEAMHAIVPKEFRIVVNHIAIGEDIYTGLLPSSEWPPKVLRQLLVNRDWPTLDSSFQQEHEKILLEIYKTFGKMDRLEKISTLLGRLKVNPDAADVNVNVNGIENSLAKLREFFQKMESVRLEEYIFFDFGLYKNQDYYTGIIFDGYIEGVGKPVLSGGCYDNLTSLFSGKTFPAVGFAIDVNEILPYLHNNLLEKRRDEVIRYFGSQYVLVNRIREAGLPTVLMGEARRKEYESFSRDIIVEELNDKELKIIHWNNAKRKKTEILSNCDDLVLELEKIY